MIFMFMPIHIVVNIISIIQADVTTPFLPDYLENSLTHIFIPGVSNSGGFGREKKRKRSRVMFEQVKIKIKM